MLKLEHIKKSYTVGSNKQVVLKKVSLSFRQNEFVAILGPSGSGKTTLLNIIGGLDNYDSGDLIINGKSTKKFKAPDWDAYRNNTVGFIFQSYNLISHINVLENVEMGMTLSGVGPKQRKKKALELLKKVGLVEHALKKPNQLSGGQMQRVAIARALANDPDIILADEPTGALDTKTSKQIMELIKEIAKEKLVIMVTHNPTLASNYATRIVEMQDGNILSDSNPLENSQENENFMIKKTAMSFLTALKLSFNNIKTKKGRTALTAFASSIGIIGIALILSLSNGFNIEVENFERDSLSSSPIMITEEAMQVDEEMVSKMQNKQESLEKYSDKDKIYKQENVMNSMLHTNNITEDYVEYIKNINKNDISGYALQTATSFNIINHTDNDYEMVTTTNYQLAPWTLLPTKVGEEGMVESTYDVLAGEVNDEEPGLVLIVDSRNRVSETTLKQLGLDGEEFSFDDILNKELKIVLNDDYYKKVGDNFIPSNDLKSLYNNENSITLKVPAILRGKEDKEIITGTSGLAYTNALTDLVVQKNKDSEIVKVQEEADYNVLTNEPFDEENTKDDMLAYLGAESMPIAIYIYPKDFESKDNVTAYLDKYNDNKDEEDMIEYTDMAEMISSLSGSIMDAITIVLIAFSSISLVVSCIMIGIITYISVLERTKEIGILRALGARKKDIRRVFNAETFIIGLFSGLLGIVIAYLLTCPANMIIENLSGLADVAKLNPLHALLLIAVSMILTIIGGAIPANMASKKDPVEALRTE